MFSSNFTKFFAASALSFLLFSGCRFFSGSGSVNSSSAPAVADELKSEIPFQTREPEQFQAEISVTVNNTERKTFIARNGSARRYDFNFGAKIQFTSLQTDKSYLLFPAKKIYAETNTVEPEGARTNEWTDFLTTEWLNEKTGAKFEKLETAENLTKYRVRQDAGASEVFVYVDETLGLPVKQEYYTIAGETRSLMYTFELKNLKLQTDENLFSVPADFKRVSTEEFWKLWKSSKD